MNCRHCGVSNTDDSVFCKGCGKRLDGSKACPSCDKPIDDDSVFCAHCGQLLTKTSAPAVTERKAEQIEQPNKLEQTVREVMSVTVKKTLNYTAVAAALAMAVFSLIFVFLIGYSSAASAAGGNTLPSGIDLYYYFGKAYKVIHELYPSEAGLYEFFFLAQYTPVVFGTIVSAITLIMVVLFSIIAIVCCSMYFAGKRKESGAGYAFAAFVSLVVGSLLLLALNNANVEIGEGAYRIKTIYRLNDATIAGVVLCSVFAAIYLGCSVAARVKELAKTEVLIKLIFSLVGAAIIAVIMALLSLPAYGIDSEQLGVWDSINIGVMYLLVVVGGICTTLENFIRLGNAGTILAFSILVYLMLIVVAIICAVLLVKTVGGSTEKKNKASSVVLNCFLVAFVVLFFVFTVLTGNQFIDAADTANRFIGAGTISMFGEEFGFVFAVPIAVLALSVLSLVLSIIQYCLINKFSSNTPRLNGTPENKASKSVQ